MSNESFTDKDMNSCDSKGSTLRAALRNPVINSNNLKFSCPSGIIILHLNWLGIKQQGQRQASAKSSRGIESVAPLYSSSSILLRGNASK